VSAVALSSYAIDAALQPGLVLGYAAVNEDEIGRATRAMAQALE
tara:strand:+ start:186 stop:317 length:132 start_codon:yes stop_codon:yes gene_type:complete